MSIVKERERSRPERERKRGKGKEGVFGGYGVHLSRHFLIKTWGDPGVEITLPYGEKIDIGHWAHRAYG